MRLFAGAAEGEGTDPKTRMLTGGVFSLVLGLNGKNAWRIWRRDRLNHASPNSGQCEAAAAGALHLRLCGPASYFGVRHDKPYIGDDDRPITPGDIDRVCRMESAGTLLALALFGGMKLIFGD